MTQQTEQWQIIRGETQQTSQAPSGGGSGSGYQVNPEGVRAAAQSLSGTLSTVISGISAVEGVVLAAAAFARIGAPVAAADATRAVQMVGAAKNLVKLLGDINTLVKQCADDYDQADQAISQAFGGSSGGTVADPSGTTDSTVTHPAADFTAGSGDSGPYGHDLVTNLVDQGVLPHEFSSMTPDEARDYLHSHPDVATALTQNNTWQPPEGDRDLVRTHFENMSADDRKWTALMSPNSVGNLSGAPFEERALANDVHITAELQAEQSRLVDYQRQDQENESNNGWFGWGSWDDNDMDPKIEESQKRIDYYQQLINDNHQVVYFDPSGDGAIAEVYGDIGANTTNVGMIVPGTTAQLSSFNDYVAGTAQGFVNSSPDHSLAMVGWMGGDLPDEVIPNAMSSSYAVDLGPNLAEFSHDLRQEINHSPAADNNVQVTAAGHSYGGAVVGAAETQGLDANRILHIESAGMGNGVTDVSDLHNANDTVWRYSMTAPGDPIDQVQGIFFGHGPHGADPDTFSGVVQLETGNYTNGTPIEGMTAHTGVFQYRSDAWWEMYNVFTGGEVHPHGQGDTTIDIP